MPDQQPNPQAFASHVLWYLCGVTVQLKEIESLLVFEVARGDAALVKNITAESAARRLREQEELFADAMKRSGLDAGQSPERPDPNP